MRPVSLGLHGRRRALVVVTAVQALCAVLFIGDGLMELSTVAREPGHALLEFAAVIALVVGTALGAVELRRLAAQNDRMRSSLRAASGAFLDLLEDSFARWGLTPSERDVALLSVKGLSVAEIAEARSTRPGTVKAQSAAVYRKAGVASRAELLSLFIDDLMDGVGPSRGAAAAGERRASA